MKNPAIVHLTNSFLITNRAWYANSNHPRKALYEKYKMLTPWKDEPGFKDTRKRKDKIVQFFVNHLPKKIVLVIASKLYNNYRVKKIKRTIIDAQSKNIIETE